MVIRFLGRGPQRNATQPAKNTKTGKCPASAPHAQWQVLVPTTPHHLSRLGPTHCCYCCNQIPNRRSLALH